MTMHQKVESLTKSGKKPLKKSKKIIKTAFFWHGPLLFFLDHLFCLSQRKTHWTMAVDRVGLKKYILRTSTSVVTLPFFPWCKPKSSRDNFNVQSHRLDGRGTTSWSIVRQEANSKCIKGRFTPRGRANSSWGRLHEILAFFGLEVGLNFTLK